MCECVCVVCGHVYMYVLCMCACILCVQMCVFHCKQMYKADRYINEKEQNCENSNREKSFFLKTSASQSCIPQGIQSDSLGNYTIHM